MKYLIVEDERFACEELKRMVTKLRPGYLLEEHTKTVIDTIEFLKVSDVDLIFMDIQLADGNCFEVFNQLDIFTPIIFTTAYDEHAIKAFKLNSIDYLLKPFDEMELEAALNKYENNYHNSNYKNNSKKIEQALFRTSKNRFLISKGESYHYVETEDIAHFYSENGVVFLHTFKNKRYIINYTLDQLVQQLNTRKFFRVSRNCIANVRAIESITKHLNSRLKLFFLPECPHEVLVSRVRVPDFLKWIDGIVE